MRVVAVNDMITPNITRRHKMADQVKITMTGARNCNKEELQKVYDASRAVLSKYNNGWLVSGHAAGADNAAELAAVEASGVSMADAKVRRVNWDEVNSMNLQARPRIIMYLPNFTPDYYNTHYVHPVDKEGKSLPIQLLPVNFDNMPSTMTLFPPREMATRGQTLTALFNPQGKSTKTLIRDMAKVLGSGSPAAITNVVAYAAKPAYYKSAEDGNTYLGDELVSGETGQTVRLAMFLGIPCWNLSDQKQYAEFMDLVSSGQIPEQRQFRDNIQDSYEALEAAISILNSQGIKIEKFEDIAGLRLRGFFKNDGKLRLEPIPQEELQRIADYTPFPIQKTSEHSKGEAESAERVLYSIHNGRPIVTSIDIRMKDAAPEELAEKLQQTIDALVKKTTEEGKTEKRFYGLNVIDFSKVEDALQPESFEIITSEGKTTLDKLFAANTEKFKENKDENEKYLKPASLYYNFLYISALIKHFSSNGASEQALSQYNGFTDSRNGGGINAVSPAEAMNLYFYMKQSGLLGKVFNQYDPETKEKLHLTSPECFDKFRETVIEKYYIPKLKADTANRIYALKRALDNKKISPEYYEKNVQKVVDRALFLARGLGEENPDEADYRPDFSKRGTVTENKQMAEATAAKYNSIFSDSNENVAPVAKKVRVAPQKAVDNTEPVKVAPVKAEPEKKAEPVTPIKETKAAATKTTTTKGNTAAKRARASKGGAKDFS